MTDQQLNPNPLANSGDITTSTETVTQLPSSDSQVVEVKIRPFTHLIITTSFFLAVLAGLISIILGLTLLSKQTKSGLISILAGILIIYLLARIVTYVPSKIRLEGNIISTRSILGKRQMDLTKLAYINAIRDYGQIGFIFYSLKLTNTDGKNLYLDLGAIERNNRIKLYEGLKGSFNSPTAQISTKATYIVTKQWGLV